MGLIIEIVIRILVSALNQFTSKDLNEFIEQFPKEVGRKIGEAAKGNIEPIKKWLSENTSNLKLFISILGKRKVKNELILPDDRLEKIKELIDAILESINLIKKPILLKEVFGNVKYYSLWEIEGYTNNAYNLSNQEIIPSTHFTISLIESDKIDYDRLMKYVSKTQNIPKRIAKKSLKVISISANEVKTDSNRIWNKWINKKERITLNFSLDSYLNLLGDIEKNIELSKKEKNLWGKIKGLVGF